MNDEFKQAVALSLECPVCLNVFNEPKTLSCSHTYCKVCLERLLECRSGDDQISCPVCRKLIPVPGGDVSQLQTSIVLKSLTEDVKNQHQICTNCKSEEKPEAVVYCQDCSKYLCVSCQQMHCQWSSFANHQVITMTDISSGTIVLKRCRKCRKHPSEDEECFCSDCRKYVCFRCGMLEHEKEGHSIMKACEHEEAEKKKIETLGSKVKTKTGAIQQYVDFIDDQHQNLDDKLQQLLDNIDRAYDQSVRKLMERKELLRLEAQEKIGDLKTNLLDLKNLRCQQISRIKAVNEMVGNGLKIPMEQESLIAHDTLCQELEGILGQEDPDFEEPRKAVSTGKKITFERNIGTNELGLGEVGEIEWIMLKDVHFYPHGVNGMAATPDGRMAVGYNGGGIDIFSADGQLQQTVLKGANVLDIGFLSDGRYVLRDKYNNISLYTPECEKLDVKFEALRKYEDGFGGLAVCSDDQIYVSYWENENIQVCTPAGGKSVREIPCDGYEPGQIVTMKSSKLLVVKDSPGSVRVIDQSGVKKHNVMKDGDIFPYPCVCQDDSILIAWVKRKEGLVSIVQYTHELKYEETLITDHKIQLEKSEWHWYYLQEFHSGEIAFCTPNRLYIFHKLFNPDV